MPMVIPMPLDKDGNGPADAATTVRTVYEIWDDDYETISVHNTRLEAQAALKELEHGGN